MIKNNVTPVPTVMESSKNSSTCIPLLQTFTVAVLPCFPRFRALALFRRLSSACVVDYVKQASENLHTSGHHPLGLLKQTFQLRFAKSPKAFGVEDA